MQKTTQLNSSLMELPILKHFNADEIKGKVDNFRKGEKGIYRFLQILVFGSAAWGIWTYVLPKAFLALGQMVALILTGGLLVAAVILFPAFVKGLRFLSRALQKFLIGHDPFGQMQIEREKMDVNKQKFRGGMGKINTLKSDMQLQAQHSEKEAAELQAKVTTLFDKSQRIKADMEAMVAAKGPAAKEEDAYIELISEFNEVTADARRISIKLKQAKEFIDKYGSRAKIMQKFAQKLKLVETEMEIKIGDFDATIDMLKKDYEFAQKSRAASTAAKDAMLFQKGWELEYAIDVVTSTIAEDIATTAGNMRDIDSITANCTLDSDELYANLSVLAENIKTGKDVIPSAKAYNNPTAKITQADKINSGGFGDIF